MAVAVLLCFAGCGRQESTIPSIASEYIDAESAEDPMQEEKHQENREEIHSKEQSAQLQPDNAELDRQPEQEAILSQARTTATFDVGSFLN